MMDDMGLTIAAKKTKTITMVRGKRVEKDEGLQLADDVIEDLGNNLYKFLGVDEAEQQENKVVLKKAETEVIRRVSVILDTPMSDHNKISAINIFALPVLTYFMPVIYFSQEDLNEIVEGAKNVLSRGRMVQVKKDFKQSTWQGNTTAHRMVDENVELPECFN